jgi:hypothetical protein
MSLTIIGTLTDGTQASQITDGIKSLALTTVNSVNTIPVDVKSLTPEQSSTSILTQVPASVTSVSVLVSNSNRKGFFLYNATNHTVNIALSAIASVSAYSFPLLMGSLYSQDSPIYSGAVSAIWPSSSTGNLLVTELT